MNYYCNLILLFVVSVMHGQEFQFVKFVSEDVQIVQDQETTLVTLCFEIFDGYHIQLEEVEDDNLLATKIDFENQKHLEILDTKFASRHYETVILDKKSTQVLSHTFKVIVKLNLVGKSETPILKGKLFYQTCDDFKCYFPRELFFTVPINNL